MPIRVPDALPAVSVLERENIFIMKEGRAVHQDIRPLRIAILNLMPKKIETETQLLRLLGNSPLQVDVELMQVSSHQSKNTPAEHLLHFYHTFRQLRDRRFDGLILTGAPVEQLPFQEVDYWEELSEIMDWSRSHVYSTLHICWGAQAGLYHHYGIQKRPLEQKLFGVFPHVTRIHYHPLTRGFDEEFLAPHSRHTTVWEDEVAACPQLEILADSPRAGLWTGNTAGTWERACPSPRRKTTPPGTTPPGRPGSPGGATQTSSLSTGSTGFTRTPPTTWRSWRASERHHKRLVPVEPAFSLIPYSLTAAQ